MTSLKRREFLKLGAASIVGSGLAGFPQVALGQSAPNDYKALVCLFLFGGNDGFNLVVPTNTDSYAEYAASRQNLAIANDILLPFSPLTSDGRSYGFHPQAAALQSLFADGNLAIMGNTGHLIEPVTREQFLNESVRVPTELFSHNNQQQQWKTVDNSPSNNSGWGGRIANFFAGEQDEPLLSSIALNGKSSWLTHPTTLDLSISAGGFDDYWYVKEGTGYVNQRRAAHLENLYRDYPKLFHKEIADVQRRTLELVESVGSVLANTPDINTVFPEDNGYGVASQMKTVAKMIAAREGLGMNRQVFFVGMGGFDTHDTQNVDQAALFTMLTSTLKAFDDAMKEIGAHNEVTTFTASEFGRTLTSNGDGTDHGWGSHQLVMGGAVKGGDIYGTMPSLAIEGVDDSGRRGRIIPTTSVEQYVQSMLSWYGLDATQIQTVLPKVKSHA